MNAAQMRDQLKRLQTKVRAQEEALVIAMNMTSVACDEAAEANAKLHAIDHIIGHVVRDDYCGHPECAFENIAQIIHPGLGDDD